MIFSPSKESISSLLNLLGRLLCFLGLLFLVPAAIALFLGENPALFDFLTSLFITETIGLLFLLFFPYKQDLDYSLAFLLVALVWLILPLFSALPLWFSGHFKSFLDAFFDSMSGFTTTGLSLIRDLDHLSYSHNFFRHFIMFLGGQGIIIVALSFSQKASSYGVGLYVGEARQERILPSIISTSRFIWTVTLVYFVIGSLLLFLLGLKTGLPCKKALFHGMFLFMAGFDTGGFTPQTLNLSYYHSLSLELATLIVMLLGSLNFNLHYFLWRKNPKEILKNIETRTFFISFSLLFIFLNLTLALSSKLPLLELFRKGLYQILTAHTGCGFSNLTVSQLKSWPEGSLVFIIIAMALGGGVGSTTGGIKLMRIGLLFKSIVAEVKTWIFPVQVKMQEKYHHLQDFLLEDRRVKLAFIVFFFYLLSYLGGAVIGVLLGYPFLPALFESTSASANVGLTLGITSPQMPVLLKLTYIIQMWAGRLEFVSVVASLGIIISLFKK